MCDCCNCEEYTEPTPEEIKAQRSAKAKYYTDLRKNGESGKARNEYRFTRSTKIINNILLSQFIDYSDFIKSMERDTSGDSITISKPDKYQCKC